MAQLAINGGEKVLKKPLSRVSNIGVEEEEAAVRVIRSGVLSDYVGVPGEFFLGGKEVRAFEQLMCETFKVKHAVSVNSATSALHSAIVALGIGPGDEVIVSPYTMSASATAILMNGAVPIFADIEEDTYCLDPKSVEERITARTKAIMVVNLFGGVARFDELKAVADKHSLRIIEDNAQSPGAIYKGQYAGTLADIGVFSFNVHKVIQSGEGGVLVTNDDEYAIRAQMSRNHGEVYADLVGSVTNKAIFGSNYRMTELHAAICAEQLKKIDFLNDKRLLLVDRLTKGLVGIPGMVLPTVLPDTKHVFYVYPIRLTQEFPIARDRFVDAMAAEGFPLSKGYVKPIYLLKIFQERTAFNKTHFPFDYGKDVRYPRGLCPVTERLYEREFTFTAICQHPYTNREIDLFVTAVRKILDHKEELL